jgi:hypothetical protein
MYNILSIGRASVFGCDTLLRIPTQVHAAKPSVASSFLRERITHTGLDLQTKIGQQSCLSVVGLVCFQISKLFLWDKLS